MDALEALRKENAEQRRQLAEQRAQIAQLIEQLARLNERVSELLAVAQRKQRKPAVPIAVLPPTAPPIPAASSSMSPRRCSMRRDTPDRSCSWTIGST